MSTRTPHHAPLRFARSADEAFRTARYGAAIERTRPSIWRRLARAIWGWL